MGRGFSIYNDLKNAILPSSGKILPQGVAFGLASEAKWTLSWGTTVPSDAATSYATGSLFLHTDGAELTALYVNVGSNTSAAFRGVVTTPLTDAKSLAFGTGSDVTINWTGSLLQISPATADTGSINIGNGTADIDFKVFLGSASEYALFDVGDSQLKLEDVAMKINTLSSTVGNGYPLSASATVALGAYGDDANAATGSGTMTRVIEGRMLLAYTAGNREQEAVGVMGKLVSKAGTNRHNMCGVMGSYEVNTSLTVGGQAYTTDTWCQAAVIGRVGAGSGITTVDTNGVLAGVAAMSNTTSFAANSGIFPAFYAGRWGGTSLKQWDYGMYAEDIRQAAYYNAAYGTLPASEKRSLDLVSTATAVSGSSFVGANFKATIAGTAASWVSGLFVNCTQASKAVNGYLCAAELELTSTAANASDNSVLVLNSVRNHTGSAPACDPYVMLRDYGTTYANVFARFGVDAADATAMGTLGATSAAKLVSQAGAAFEANCDCVVRCMAGTTVFWLLGSTTGPS